MITNDRTLIADVESDGLLPTLTCIHCLVIKDAKTREVFRFRKHGAYEAFECHPLTQPGVLTKLEAVDTIADGIKMLEEAGRIVFHNGVGFDLKALKKIYPTFKPRGKVQDSLVLTRVIIPDTSEGDMKLWRRGVLPGALIKSHSLDAWGYRMGLHKGSYSEEMEKLGRNPWAFWNMDLEDYCENDVDVTEVVWTAIETSMPPDTCNELEHACQDLCSVLEANGFPFGVPNALALKGDLQSAFDVVATEVKNTFGPWYVPEKKWRVAIEWDDPDGANAKQLASDLAYLDAVAAGTIEADPKRRVKYHHPRGGEDTSRAWWGDVTIPKKTMNVRTTVPKELCAPSFTHMIREAGSPYCRIELKDFNPGSRHDVIDRFQQLYAWKPTEFTEKGSPEVNDGVLQGLVEQIPIAEKVAECFFVNKYLGQLSDGPRAWLKTFDKQTQCIHCYINVGGTVSGRCSHVGPNLGQVPSVIEAKVRLKDGSLNPQFLDADGRLQSQCYDWFGNEKVEAPLRGRPGEWGFECRSLFGVLYRNLRVAAEMGITVAELEARGLAWRQVGVDLSQIEFRCLAELTQQFDGGELIRVIVSGQDIHDFNQKKTGIATRTLIKRCLYCIMYGGGDYKLGITADPKLTLFEEKAKALGRSIRAQIMAGLPALDQAIKQVKREAQRGYLIGLDGRKLHCRSEHSALNLRLQSDAALIAKRWMVLTEWYALDQEWDHGWAGDFAMMAFVHDEQQNATRPEIMKDYAALSIRAAADAGLDFGFVCPIEAKAKFGLTWGDCH